MNTPVKWEFEADFVQGCSCDYGCPCEFSAPPTRGFCDGMGAWRINRGRFDRTPLDGLGLAFAAHWPKAIHEGNGTVCAFVDEKAAPAQREALLRIITGEVGGMPFEILKTTFSRVLAPQFLPFEFHLQGKTSRVRIGDAFHVNLAPILNPVTGEPEEVRLEHSTGFVFKSADCASTETCRVAVDELSFSWPNKAAFVTRVQYGN